MSVLEAPRASKCTPDQFCSDEDKQEVQKLLTSLESKWALKHESKSTDFKCFHQQQENGDSPMSLIRGEGTVEADLLEVLDFIDCPAEKLIENRKIMDVLYIDGKILTQMDPKHQVLWAVFKLPPPCWKRDFVWWQYTTMLDEDTAVMVCKSTTHADAPEQNGFTNFVRGEIVTTGFYLKKTGEGKCHLTYLVQADPKGWIPTLIVNAVAADAADNVKRVMKHFAKNKK